MNNFCFSVKHVSDKSKIYVLCNLRTTVSFQMYDVLKVAFLTLTNTVKKVDYIRGSQSHLCLSLHGALP